MSCSRIWGSKHARAHSLRAISPDVKRMEKRGKNLGKLRDLLGLLIAGHDLPAMYKDHPLKGD
ncbi:type II toxin-antitoxin system YafQ family toxin [Mesorhizobium sp. CA13]|nr:type II toxin-antitoxin system YafQ family toxin [Mesorhizobium sp. CA13]